VQRDGKDVAFAVAEGKARMHAVTVGRTLGDDREVLSGLEGGDVVVVEPPEKLQDGAIVRVAPESKDATANSE
jgi:hypothetical protein